MDKNGTVPAFFCVPDLTGFTKFVALADIEYTKVVIPGVLRKLIESNILKMSVGEIEGDAIFFYRTGRLPTIGQVVKQCQLLYTRFSDFLEELEEQDPAKYKKFFAEDQFGLKIIIHYGHIGIANIKGRQKLLGEDVIIAHKLLKNSIPDYNYILLTDKYLSKVRDKKKLNELFHWEELHSGKESFNFLGEVSYKYITLDEMSFMDNVQLSKSIRKLNLHS